MIRFDNLYFAWVAVAAEDLKPLKGVKNGSWYLVHEKFDNEYHIAYIAGDHISKDGLVLAFRTISHIPLTMNMVTFYTRYEALKELDPSKMDVKFTIDF